jgi:regulator of sigma E protease
MIVGIVMNIYWGLLLLILFSFTIFVHELGHFLVAVRCGMVVETFSIGFGPAIWKRKVRGITYKIGCIPFGGYVALPQLDPAGMQHVQGRGECVHERLPEVAAWKKILVSLSGVTGNIILAVILAWVIYLHPKALTAGDQPLQLDVDPASEAYASGLRPGDVVQAVDAERVHNWNEFLTECHLGGGTRHTLDLRIKRDGKVLTVSVPTAEVNQGFQTVEGIRPAAPPPVFGDVRPDSAAEEAGLEAGDRVLTFNGTPVRDWIHFVDLTRDVGEQKVELLIERHGETFVQGVTPRYDPLYEKAIIGVGPVESMTPPWMQHKRPLAQVRHDARGILRILRALTSRREGVARRAAGALGGPPMILAVLWASIKVSFLNALGFIRFLNINLAILNLLPIPVLDGGHIVFALWEVVTRRKAHPRLVNILVNICAVLLIGLMLVLTWRDVFRIFPGLSDLFDRSSGQVEGSPSPGGAE